MSTVEECYQAYQAEKSRLQAIHSQVKSEVETVQGNLRRLEEALASAIRADLATSHIESEILKEQTNLKRAELRAAAIGDELSSPKLAELAQAVISAGEEATAEAVAKIEELDRTIEGHKEAILSLLARRRELEHGHYGEIEVVKSVINASGAPVDVARFFLPVPLRERSKFELSLKEVDKVLGKPVVWAFLRDHGGKA